MIDTPEKLAALIGNDTEDRAAFFSVLQSDFVPLMQLALLSGSWIDPAVWSVDRHPHAVRLSRIGSDGNREGVILAKSHLRIRANSETAHRYKVLFI